MGGLILILLLALNLPPVGDQVNLDRDPTVRSAYAGKWSTWSRIYREYADWRGEAIALSAEPLRLAAEYRAGDAFDAKALKAAGFNGVVLLLDLADTADSATLYAMQLRGAGLRVAIAFSPRGEEHRDTVFPDSRRLSALLRRSAVHADALLIGWRRTSIHMFRQDRPYTAFLIAAARSGNPKIPVIGEIYAGETSAGIMSCEAPAFQLPPEAVAAMAVNYVRPEIYSPALRPVFDRLGVSRVIMVAFAAGELLIPEFVRSGFQDYIIINKETKP